MNTIIHFDVAAVVLLLILLYTVISRKMTKGVPDKLFISLILITLGSALADTAAILLDGYAASPEGTEALLPALYCSHSIYLILHNYTTVLYLLFIVSLTDTWYIQYTLPSVKNQALFFEVPTLGDLKLIRAFMISENDIYKGSYFHFTTKNIKSGR